MSFGLKVWSADGSVRLDTSDGTMRLTDSFYIGPKTLRAKQTVTDEFAVANFNPAVDGAFIINAEAGYLGYENPEVEDGFLPQLEPYLDGVRIIWRGYWNEYSRDVRYMGFYVVILRAAD